MPSQPEEFLYSPLLNPSTDIRLAILDPGAEEDEIKCRIIQGNQNSIGPYEALSYAWGDPTATLPILLDDKSFEVTRNLESALRNLRKSGDNPSQARILWIDAICIDQKNSEERRTQVQRMRSIYQFATRVVVWLGKYHEPEDDLVKFDQSLWGFDQLDGDLAELTREAFEHMESLHRNSLMMPSTSWGQLLRIAKRAWFSRVWVIQEVKVAKYALVLCGQHAIAWKSMVTAAVKIAVLGRISTRGRTHACKFLFALEMNKILSIAMDGEDSRVFGNLLWVLYKTTSSKASDPRDRLYGVTGIIKDEEAEDVEIDYSKAANVASVYRDWPMKRIHRKGTLDVFSACEDSGKLGAIEGNIHPSWVPDLQGCWGSDMNLFYLTHGCHHSARNRVYTASGQSRCNPKISPDGLEISLTGACLDSIALLGGTGCVAEKPILDMGHITLATVEAWENMCLEFFQGTLTHGTPLYAMFVDVLFRGYENYHEKTHISLQEYSAWRHAAQHLRVKQTPTQKCAKRLLVGVLKLFSIQWLNNANSLSQRMAI
jgi:hypothetical protein